MISAGCASSQEPAPRTPISDTAEHGQGTHPRVTVAKGSAPSHLADDAWALAAREWTSRAGAGFPAQEPLSESEQRRVREGWTVTRPLSFELDGRKYVGGVAYQIVRVPSEQVLTALLDAERLPRALPLTLDARPLQSSPTDQLSVELLQGKAPIFARYTLHLSREREDALRFALDKDRPHSIEDVRGYLTSQPFTSDYALVTVAVGFDLGRSLMRSWLERPVQKAALAAPAHLRRYLESEI